MNKENYEALRKQLDNGSLDIPSQITILEIAYNLEQQLQAYKDKEDKLREFVNKSTRPEYRNGNSNEFYLEMNEKELKKFLSIINEGDDENE